MPLTAWFEKFYENMRGDKSLTTVYYNKGGKEVIGEAREGVFYWEIHPKRVRKFDVIRNSIGVDMSVDRFFQVVDLCFNNFDRLVKV